MKPDAIVQRTLALAEGVRPFLDLDEIRLSHIEATLKVTGAPTPLRPSLGLAPTYHRGDGYVIYTFTYSVSADDADGDEVFDFQAALSVEYYVSDDAPDLTDEDLQAFGTVFAMQTVHPYARELAQSITSRMGLPSLTMPATEDTAKMIRALQKAANRSRAKAGVPAKTAAKSASGGTKGQRKPSAPPAKARTST